MNQVDSQPHPARPNVHPFRRSFAAAGGMLLIALLLVTAGLGRPDSAESFGRIVGRLALPAIVAALVTGLIARRSRKPWSWWKYVMIVLLVSLAILILAAVGQTDAT